MLRMVECSCGSYAEEGKKLCAACGAQLPKVKSNRLKRVTYILASILLASLVIGFAIAMIKDIKAPSGKVRTVLELKEGRDHFVLVNAPVNTVGVVTQTDPAGSWYDLTDRHSMGTDNQAMASIRVYANHSLPEPAIGQKLQVGGMLFCNSLPSGSTVDTSDTSPSMSEIQLSLHAVQDQEHGPNWVRITEAYRQEQK